MKKLLSLLLVALLLAAFSVSAQAPEDVVLKITIPKAHAARIINGFTKQYGWTAQVPDPANPQQMIANPVSRRDFAEALLETFVLQSVEAAEKTEAAEKARREAATDVRAIKLRP